MVYKRWGVGPRGGTSSYKTLLSTPPIVPPFCRSLVKGSTSKKNRFAVVRGYRSKRRLWTFQRRQLMTIIIIYYLCFNPPPTEKQDHSFKRKALGDLIAGRRARTSTLCPVFFFFIFRNVWHQNDITSHHSKYFVREPFSLWPLLVIRISWLKVKALLWL